VVVERERTTGSLHAIFVRRKTTSVETKKKREWATETVWGRWAARARRERWATG
jgi:hypothetical protein